MTAVAVEELTATIETRLIGGSPAMRRIRERIACLARLWTPVLVVGEPGTGRDTAVRALHELGVSADGELHQLTADASVSRSAIQRAAAVYLDGVESHSADVQAYWADRLSRSEPRAFGDRPRLFASATDPLLALGGGSLHPRLRDYLLRFSIELPPLRERPGDIPRIADALARTRGRVVGRSVRLSPAAGRRLAAWRWPGNVRELERLLERMIAFSPEPVIGVRVVDEVLAEAEESVERIRERRAWEERERLIRAIRETGGNITHTAQILGTSRSGVYRRIEKHGIALARARGEPAADD